MAKILFQQYLIEDRSYVSFIKREIHNLLKPVFPLQRAAEIDIVVSELASNLIKYAQRGEFLYRLSEEDKETVFELICIDNGPGMADVGNSMKDGISSKNTLGHGLGSISRLSNVAQFYSLPNWGTVIYAKFYSDITHQQPKHGISIACLNVAKPGEQVSGDGVAIKRTKDKTIIMVGDGLGHGPHAKEAVDRAATAFNSSMYSDPCELIREIHAAAKRTRGLVTTTAMLDHKNKALQLCGVGNIYCRIQKGLEFKSYYGHNGVVGLNIPGRLVDATFPIEKPIQLIFCSDGIKTKWDLMRYPGISKYDAMMLAAVLYKDHSRQTDDMTILTVKIA